MKNKPRLSIIITAYNEEENIAETYKRIKESLSDIDYKIIFVDDGSTDNTKDELEKIGDENVKIIHLDKNTGKSYAYFTGFNNAKNEIIATLDADLQDNPVDILKLLNKLSQGYDLVCGWRHKRNDNFVKRVSSKIGNFINNKTLNIKIHDNNCPIKVFKKKCFEDVLYFKNMHRFLPVLAQIQGFKIGEEKVEHFPRIHGKSKYGVYNRVFGNLKTLYLIRFKRNNILKEKYINQI